MPRRVAAALALVALVAAVATAPAAARPRIAKRMAAFDSCGALVAYARRHVRAGDVPVYFDPLPVVAPGPPMVVAPGTPLPALDGEDSSRTNVQEAGVDEPDIVKTDGQTIFAVESATLHAVAARGAGAPRLLGTLSLGDAWDATLLLHGDRILALGYGPRGARMTEIDVSDPARMRVVRTEDVEGRIIGARLTGRSARIVVVSSPDAITGPAELRSQASGWLPTATLATVRTGLKQTRRAVGCRAVRRPAVFSGAGILTVFTVDLDRGLPAIDADAVFASGDTVYASPASLFVATRRWTGDVFGANTAIHRFDASDPDRTRYAATGAVAGELLGQFSLSERRGILRAATTIGGEPGAESRVTTLDEHDGRLVERGRVDGLGPGERIYAVRFIDDVGYVVTFRQTDPLYTVDLSDPDHPRVAGQLKIPGYSAYLHPVGDDLLLGVGQEATGDGLLQGLQLSLFDVADLAHPARLARLRLGERWSGSAAEWDHHAFLWWPATRLALLPISSAGFVGAAGYHVTRASGISELGSVAHEPTSQGWTPPIDRAVIVGPNVFTLSQYGIKGSALADFAAGGWAAFPAPPQVPVPIAEPAPIDLPVSSGGG